MKKDKGKQNNEKSNNSKNKKSSRKEKKIYIKTSRVIQNNLIAEMVYPVNNKPVFLVWDKKLKSFKIKKYILEGRLTYTPYVNRDLILNKTIRIPSKAKKYGNTKKLIYRIRKFIDKYVYIKDSVDKEIIITYILLTWVYDRFSAIPYLRAIGGLGTGKSRLLKVLNLCYKSIYTFSLASSAPIFRIIDEFGGTVIIDEMELGKGTEKNADIREILRAGKENNGVVLRCDPKTYKVLSFKVFGPKILGSRYTSNDAALESRIINIRMVEAKGDSVPLMIEDKKFERECEYLRSKLLVWRLKNYFKIDINAYRKYIDFNISKRLNEIYAPLICVREHDRDFIKSLLGKAKKKHMQLLEDKSMSMEANIIREIYYLHNSCSSGSPLVQEIADNLRVNFDRKFSSRFIGSIISENFGLKTEHTNKGNVVVYDRKKVISLIEEYHLEKILNLEGEKKIEEKLQKYLKNKKEKN